MDFFDYTTDFDIDEFLERAQENQKQRLEAELEQIQDQLENRDQLHNEIIDELEAKRNWYVERLKTLYLRDTGKHGKREQVKNRIEHLYRQVREEQRSHWQDRQELERERRELLRALEELEDTEIHDLL